MRDPDFYLASADGYYMEEPRRCWRIRRMATEKRDDLLLVRIDPPLVGQRYGLGDREVDEVLVASRHRGASLFPIGQWPVFVHVLRAVVDIAGRDRIQANQVESIGWAELYRTEGDARTKAM